MLNDPFKLARKHPVIPPEVFPVVDWSVLGVPVISSREVLGCLSQEVSNDVWFKPPLKRGYEPCQASRINNKLEFLYIMPAKNNDEFMDGYLPLFFWGNPLFR